jgi:hypothetical protein
VHFTLFPTAGDPGKAVSVGVSKFYQVDRLVYRGGADTLPAFGADDAALAGDGNTYAVQKAWLDYLYKNGKDLEFDLIYYVADPNADDAVLERATRTDFKFAEYYKAVYTTNTLGYARAALPALTGSTSTYTYANINNPARGAGVTDSVRYGYDLSLRLFYYNPLIVGGPGRGYIPNLAATTDSTPNAAIIAITENELIREFDDIIWQRKDATPHAGEPSIVSGEIGPDGGTTTANGDAANRRNLFNNLKRYYDLYYSYEGGITVLIPQADWLISSFTPKTVATLQHNLNADGTRPVGYLRYVNTKADEIETEDSELTMIEPLSTRPRRGNSHAAEFAYRQINVELPYLLLP